MNRARYTIVLSAALSAIASTARGDTFEWANPVDGNYNDATKWTRLSGTGSAPPGVGDTAIFNKTHSWSDYYSIGLTGNVTLDALTATGEKAVLGSAIGQPRRTLNVTGGGADFTVNGSNAEFYIGSQSGEAGLNVTVGDATTVSNGGFLWLGQSQFSTERLLLGTTGGTPTDMSALVVGGPSVLGVTTTAATTIGTAGSGHLGVYGTAIFNGELRVGRSGIADQVGQVVAEGGAVSAPNVVLGGGAGIGSRGEFHLTQGSEGLLTSSLTIGGAAGTGAATFSVQNSRLLSPQTSTTINRTGTMVLRGTTDTYLRSDLNVNGGTLIFDGNHQNLTYAPGVDITVRPEGKLIVNPYFSGGALVLPAASNVVQAGGHYQHNAGTVTIPSGGSLTLNGTTDLHSDTRVIGTLNFNPTNDTPHSRTSFYVENGGRFNSQVQWTPQTGGTLSVTGNGAAFRDLTAGTFELGHNMGWSMNDRAVVAADAGGTFQKDSGIVDIGRHGTMNIAGGVVIADDIVKHAEGQFNFTSGQIIIDNPLPIGSWSPMPGDMNLGNGKKIQTLSTATIESARFLQLTGGELRGNSIVNTGAIQLDAGTLALTGGTYTGPAVTIGANAALVGAGSVNARISGATGSRIIAEGDLALGDATHGAGFAHSGDIQTGPHTMTLRDSNAAVLGSLTQIGTAAVPGTLVAPNGLLLSTGSTMTGYGAVNTPNDSEKAFIADGSVTGESNLRNITLAGYVKGAGSFHDVTFAGTFDPGQNGTAKITTGDVSFAPSSTLKIGLGGSGAGSGFDQIDAAGFGVQLGGTLDLATVNNYQPPLLVPHRIVAADGMSGQFDTIAGVIVSPTTALAVTYEEESVFVTAAMPGDANLSGSVTLADFNVLAANFGVSAGATWVGGDFTGDGAVTLVDFNALAGNFGLSAGAGGPSIQDWTTLQSAVPEPSGLLPLICLGALLGRRRR